MGRQFRTAVLALVCLALSGIWAAENTIDFEGLAAGTILTEISADTGAGPITIFAEIGSDPGVNRAVIFDSSNPTGGDIDLGTPNTTCPPGGGPGVGIAGEFGQPTENCVALGNLLIIAEDLVDDSPADGFVDDPDDVDEVGARMVLDFSALGGVQLNELALLDIEADIEPDAKIELFGAGDVLLATFNEGGTGNNGKRVVGLGPTAGVYRMEITLNGSGATDNIVFVTDDDPFCGDENLDPGEECDPPGSVPDPNFPNNLCRDDCTYCGDGIVNDGEECDFNDPDAPAGCTETCTIAPFCGDGMVDPGEQCDPPGSVPDPNYPDNTCRDDCTYCGDGIVNDGEECDFNDPEAPDSCTDTCMIDEPLGCRFTGGGVDTNFNWDHTLESGEMIRNGVGNLPEGIDRYTFGGQAGANTALPPQPAGEWTHHQQTGPSGRFTFHGGTNSAPEGTEIIEIRCSDPGFCQQARPAPAKQLDFDGIGTFKNLGNGNNYPEWQIADPNVTEEGHGNQAFDGTYHYFEVNVDDLGERGGDNTGSADTDTCPSIGFGEKGARELADCDCPDFYRITIYDGVDRATLDSTGPNTTNVIYEVYGYVDGGNLQIHPLTGYDQN